MPFLIQVWLGRLPCRIWETAKRTTRQANTEADGDGRFPSGFCPGAVFRVVHNLPCAAPLRRGNHRPAQANATQRLRCHGEAVPPSSGMLHSGVSCRSDTFVMYTLAYIRLCKHALFGTQAWLMRGRVQRLQPWGSSRKKRDSRGKWSGWPQVSPPPLFIFDCSSFQPVRLLACVVEGLRIPPWDLRPFSVDGSDLSGPWPVQLHNPDRPGQHQRRRGWEYQPHTTTWWEAWWKYLE